VAAQSTLMAVNEGFECGLAALTAALDEALI
jgi:hypothetical protein